MPISLKNIAANIATVTFFYGEDSVTVVYYPARITEKTLADMQVFSSIDTESLQGITSGFHAFNELLVHLIKSWDVYEDDEQKVMFPIEADRLAELPIDFRLQIIKSITSDLRPEAIASQQK